MSELAAILARELAAPPAGEAPHLAPWADGLRERARQDFSRNGLPSTRVEAWKYTSLRGLERTIGALGALPAETGPEAPPPLVDGPRLVVHNGQLAGVQGEVPIGVTITDLRTALANDREGLREMLESLPTDQPADGFVALNSADLGPGVLVHVAAGTDAGRLLLQWCSGPSAAGRLCNSRVCVRLEPGARLEMIEQFEGEGAAEHCLNAVTQVHLGEQAELAHACFQQWPRGSALIALREIRQAAASRYHYTGLDAGASLVRHDVRTTLAGPGAGCRLDVACLGMARAHADNHLQVTHEAGDCASVQTFRGVLAGRARAVFNGRVLVQPGADGTDASQSSAGLLLSPHAEIDAKPELEIHADEVTASHGATVGQLDEDAIFYLRSRGLDVEAARQLLTMAFCRPVTDAMRPGPLREALSARLDAALQALGSPHG